jgi:enoyl-CoA hydratase/carnithine racemase
MIKSPPQRTSRLVRQLTLTAKPVGADDALRHGLINAVLSGTDQAEERPRLAEQLGRRSASAPSAPS